ncbi:hypothetical protein HS7_05090 [Sulfolobales archaeon HS-7]|nr:hypothetical protein HS7_05090 [Sulfolobales archaeon HS-7]
MRKVSFKVSMNYDGEMNKVWEIVSDVQAAPKYWKGIRNLDVIKKDNVYEGEIRFAFPSSGKIKIVIYDYVEQWNFLSGAFTGVNTVSVLPNEVVSEWDIKLSPILSLFRARIESHFKLGTEHALSRILNAVKERQ